MERSLPPSDRSGADFMDCKQCPLRALGVCRPASELQERVAEGTPKEIDEACEEAHRVYSTGQCSRKGELEDALTYCTGFEVVK